MGGIFSTVLITAPLAFMAGWLVSKAVFRNLSIVRPHSASVGITQPAAINQIPAKPDIPGRTNDQQIALLEQRLEIAQTDKRTAMHEVQLLKEAIAEREHRMNDLREQLKMAYLPPEDTAAGATELKNVKHSKEMRDLQQRAARNDEEITKLRHEIIGMEKRLAASKLRSRKWRDRFKPLGKQFRQQKLIITELREEMRQRELRREREQNQTAPPRVAPPVAQAQPPREPRDNLEQLHGVGPALHEKLNKKGVYRLEQLAKLTDMDMRRLGRSLGISERQIDKHDWNTQARQLLGPADAARPAAGNLINA